jgi:hypothetical protein
MGHKSRSWGAGRQSPLSREDGQALRPTAGSPMNARLNGSRGWMEDGSTAREGRHNEGTDAGVTMGPAMEYPEGPSLRLPSDWRTSPSESVSVAPPGCRLR